MSVARFTSRLTGRCMLYSMSMSGSVSSSSILVFPMIDSRLPGTRRKGMLRFLLRAMTESMFSYESHRSRRSHPRRAASSITFPTLSMLPMISTPATFSPILRRLVSMNPSTSYPSSTRARSFLRSPVRTALFPTITVRLPKTVFLLLPARTEGRQTATREERRG